MSSSELIQQPITTISSPASSTKSQSILSLTLKLLFIVALLFLICTTHMHSTDIGAISQTLQLHLKVDHESYQQFVNESLTAFQTKIKYMQKEIEKFEKIVQFQLKNHRKFLNDSSKLLYQLDESINNLESIYRRDQFIKRKQAMQAIIYKNETKANFDDQYEKYTRQYYLSLNNIQNPYFDVESKTNLQTEMNKLTEIQYQNYEEKYNISDYEHELSTCVIVPTRNNAFQNRFIYNLQSILNQKYTNYFVVIVDDHSEDNTPVLIERYLRKRNIGKDKVVVIKNQQKQGSLSNIHFAVHNYCRNYTITLEVDGDDELIGTYVFKLFNAVYQAKNPGFAYSNHVYYSEDEGYISKGYSEAYSKLSIEKQNYRKIIQKFGHLRSFRTNLFFQINEQDFRDAHGKFYLAAGDEAYIFPILEMSCRNIEYIDEVTYLYNGATGNNVRKAFKKVQEENAIYIRLQKKYPCLAVYQNPLLST